MMKENDLKIMLKQIGLNTENNNGVFKGNAGNINTWYVFRIWINKSGKVTIKCKGVQKSFNINKNNELKKELRGFQII